MFQGGDEFFNKPYVRQKARARIYFHSPRIKGRTTVKSAPKTICNWFHERCHGKGHIYRHNQYDNRNGIVTSHQLLLYVKRCECAGGRYQLLSPRMGRHILRSYITGEATYRASNFRHHCIAFYGRFISTRLIPNSTAIQLQSLPTFQRHVFNVLKC